MNNDGNVGCRNLATLVANGSSSSHYEDLENVCTKRQMRFTNGKTVGHAWTAGSFKVPRFFSALGGLMSSPTHTHIHIRPNKSDQDDDNSGV